MATRRPQSTGKKSTDQPGEMGFSVEIQREFDVATKAWQERVFVKVFAFARTSGLIAALGAQRWQTLSVLATYMNAAGECFPSQEEIAQALGITRSKAALRLKDLLAFRWEGRPLVVACRARAPRSNGRGGERWENNRYTILPVSGFTFGPEQEPTPPAQDADSGRVCQERHIGQVRVYQTGDTLRRHTNKIQSKQDRRRPVCSYSVDPGPGPDDDRLTAQTSDPKTAELQSLVKGIAPTAVPSAQAAAAFIKSAGGLAAAIASVSRAAAGHRRTKAAEPIRAWAFFLAAADVADWQAAPSKVPSPCPACRGQGLVFDLTGHLVPCGLCAGAGRLVTRDVQAPTGGGRGERGSASVGAGRGPGAGQAVDGPATEETPASPPGRPGPAGPLHRLPVAPGVRPVQAPP